MARKRPSASPSAPSPKKLKRSSSQTKLDGFFRGANSQQPVTSFAASRPNDVIVIDDDDDDSANVALDVDAILAAKLAEEEGIDIEVVRRLELEWSVGTAKGGPERSSTATPHTPSATLQKSEELYPSGSRITTGLSAVAPMLDISWPDLSQDPLLFSTTACPWVIYGAATPYAFLAHTLSTLSSTRSRIAIVNTLTNSIRLLTVHDPASLLPALYLLSNGLAPVYSPQPELGIGWAVITKAIQHVSGLSSGALRKLYAQSGDPGDVAFAAKSSLRTLVAHPSLTICGVYKSLLQIANTKGQGSGKTKQSIVEKLLLSAQGDEVRYLVRTLGQNLRVGAVRTTILTALARAMVLDRAVGGQQPGSESEFYVDPVLLIPLSTGSQGKPGSGSADESLIREQALAKFAHAESTLRRVFVQHPSYDHIVEALLECGLEGIQDRVRLVVGIPLHPTLGSPARSLDEVYELLGESAFSAEMKLDGQRGQIHAFRDGVDGVTIKIFSRHLEDMTDKYPDICLLVEHIFAEDSSLKSFIIDSEIVAIDKKTNALRSFQELSNRARKDVQLKDVKVAVCVFIFDVMYLNSQILIHEPFRRRRELLHAHFPPQTPDDNRSACLAHMSSCESVDGREALESFWKESIDMKTEGLMIKLLDHANINDNITASNSPAKSRRKPLPASYEPDKRTSAWIKLKHDYVTGLGDSLDLVPIGAWQGNGRKSAWWSPILLACYDPSKGQLIAVCKCMSGFTDAFYKALNERYPADSDNCSRKSLWNVETGGLRPSVFFRPSEVWEIKGADVTLSPVSVAAFGAVSHDRGLSLRFPRFIRVRDDKSIEQASGPDMLMKMWQSQERVTKGGADDYDLVDAEESDGHEVSEVEE